MVLSALLHSHEIIIICNCIVRALGRNAPLVQFLILAQNMYCLLIYIVLVSLQPINTKYSNDGNMRYH